MQQSNAPSLTTVHKFPVYLQPVDWLWHAWEVILGYVCKQTWLINIPAVTREKCSRHHGEGSADTEGCGGSLCSDCNPVVPEHSRLWLLL